MSKMGLSLALMCAAFTSGCDLIDSTLKAMDINDPVQNIKSQGQSFVTYQPATQEPPAAVEPEPYVEPPCEDIRWRYVIYDCHWNPKGGYE